MIDGNHAEEKVVVGLNWGDDEFALFLLRWRIGQAENVYDDYKCRVEDCYCEFGNLVDYAIHRKRGRHGRMGDKNSEQNRRKFRYFTRRPRLKEELYREQSEEQQELQQ